MLVVMRNREQTVTGVITPEEVRRLADAGLGVELAVHVLDVRSNRAKLGMDGPECMTFNRKEGQLRKREPRPSRRAGVMGLHEFMQGRGLGQ